MVAIFTGLGAGFERGSAAQLGGVGLLGGGVQGRSGDRVSVNAATGNLLISRQDEFLVGRGPDVGISRTYNSFGALDENGDHWRQSTDRRVYGLTGAIDQAGSTVKRVSADGSEVTYTYTGSGGIYQATDGAGAYDTLRRASQVWTWTDGDTQITEKYEAYGTDNWRIIEQKDEDGNKLAFAYSGAKLSFITTADGGKTEYTWSGDNITSIKTTFVDSDGNTQSLTRIGYTYDSLNRLVKVTTDLKFGDAHDIDVTNPLYDDATENRLPANAEAYITTYTYYGATNRIRIIQQTDNSKMLMAYDGEGRVTSIKQWSQGAQFRETKIDYGTIYGQPFTVIDDPSGNRTILHYDDKNQLTWIQANPEQTDGTHTNTYFTYSPAGNVESVTDAEGNKTSYLYDGRGNKTHDIHPNGGTTVYKYDDNNNLVRTLTIASSSTASEYWLIKHYVYDAENHLRFKVDSSGGVAEYRYDGSGNRTYVYNYTAESYGRTLTTPNLATMESWANDVADKTQINITRHFYDARGLVDQSRDYGAATTSGSQSTSEGITDMYYTYDSAGRLLSRRTTVGDTETFVYDGLGRMVSSTDINGGTTSIVFNDAATQTTITSAGGLVTVSTYNRAGDLISETKSGSFDTTGTSTYKYDKNGRLRMVTDATGYKNYYIYDQLGRKTADINHYGHVTEYRYDDNGRIIATARYTRTKSGTAHTNMLATLADPNNTLQAKDVRYSANQATNHHAYDIWQWTAYDSLGQVSRTVMGDGSVTAYEYGKAGRLLKTHTYANKLTSDELAILRRGNEGVVNLVEDLSASVTASQGSTWGGLGANNAIDGNVNSVNHTNDDSGAWIEIDLGSEQKVQGVQITNRSSSGARLNGAVVTVRDADNNILYTFPAIEGAVDGSVITLALPSHKMASKVRIENPGQYLHVAEIEIFGRPENGDAETSGLMAAFMTPKSNSEDIINRTFYDFNGRVRGTLDGEGYLTRIVYDKAGQVTYESAFANLTSENLRASGNYNQLWASVTKSASKDVHVRSVYDGQGHLRYTIDALRNVTEYVYGSGDKAIGLVRSTIQHYTSLPILSGYKYSTVKGAVAGLSEKSKNRTEWAVYNTHNQLVYSIDATGAVLRFNYDAQGQVTKTTQYATLRATSSLPSEGTMNTWANSNSANARINRNFYTAGGVLRFSVDAEGYAKRFDYDKENRLTREIRWTGKVSATDSWTTSTINNANKGGWVDTKYAYQANGQLASVYDANGTRHLYTYYANGELAWDIRAYGHGTNQESRVLHINDAAGRRYVTRQYTGSYSDAADPDYRIYRQTYTYYDGLGQVSRVREYKGNHVYSAPDQNAYFEYDKSGNLIKQTNAEGGITEYEYNAFGQVTGTTDPNGNVTTHIYNRGGQLTRTTDALNYHTDFTYTAFGEQATVKRNNATTTFYYDKLGQITRVKDALGKSDYYKYDAFGQQIEVTNKLSGKTYHSYDKRGQLTQSRIIANVYNHVGSRVATEIINRFEYDSRGNQTKMIEAYGRTEARTTTYVYDKADQLIQKKGDAVSVYTSGADSTASTITPTEYYTYDRRGNLIESKDANGARTLYYYDRMDRVTHQISPEGTLVRNWYDANSNLMDTRVYANKVSLPSNALGTPPSGSGSYRRTTFTYDRLNRMTNSYVHDVQTAKFNGSLSITATSNDLRTQYQYDANGNVTKVIDPIGNETRSEYDKLNRKTRQYDAGGFRTDWAYNADGNVTRETRMGHGEPHRYTDFTYDKNGNRLTEKRLYVLRHNGSGAHTSQHSTISYLYNALGQVTRKTEATGDRIDYAYDAQGRLNYETRSGYVDHLGGNVSPKVQYLYNGLNDVSRVFKYGKNASISHSDSHYIYAKGGRLTSVTDGNGFIRTYRYDAKGQMVREEYVRVTNGASQTEGIGYDFDKEGRVIAQGAVVKSGSTWSRGGTSLDTVNTKYNAFGDVSERGINGKYSEKMDYDKAGRLWRTTSGDGAYKYFMHDNNGNQTLVVTSDGTNIDNKSMAQILALWGVSSAGANANKIYTDYKDGLAATITKYDARNLAIEVREPEREYHTAAGTKTRADFVTKRSYNAFGEVISETDANNKTINYTYNTMGRRIKVESPSVSITGTNGAKSNVRPTEHYYYDISGRLVASRDANGNLTRQVLLAGTGYNGSQALISETIAADGGRVKTLYDIQGNVRKITDQLNRVTTNSFDKMGNLTQINHASGLIDYYSYDGLGQQYKHWNNVAVTASYFDKITGTTIPGGPDFASTDYDAQGRIVVQRVIGGDITVNSYVWSATGVLATNGGWLQTTTLANGKQSKVYKDVFNKAIRSYDLSNRMVNYTYDKGARLTQVSGAGADTQHYYYLNTNKLDKMTVSGSNYDYSHFNATSFTRTTTYGYDKVGNLTKEQLKEHSVITHTETFYEDFWGGVQPITYTYTENKYTTLQNAKATYDALGRLKSWNELGTAAQSGYTARNPAASKVFEYDAQGNIRRTTSTYKTLDAQGVASSTNTVKDTWYKFDSMNRITTAEGQLVGGQIVRGTTGVDIAYDAAGQRAYTLKDTVSSYWDKTTGTTITTTTTTRENYTYNTGGQVTQVNISTATNGATPSATGTRRSVMIYDAMGRQTRQLDYEANGTTVAFDSTKVYNNKSQVTSDTSTTKRTDGTYKNVTTYAYGTSGTASYALGGATTVTTANYKNNAYQVTSRTTNTYAYYNGASLATTTYDSNTGSSSNPISTTSYSNSKSGVLISARVSDGRARTVSFTVDNQGQTIRRDEKDHKTGGDPHEIWYRFGGKEMGHVGNNGTYNTAFSQSITDRTTTPTTGTNAGAFKHGRTTGTNHADFDQAYQAINSYKQGSTSGSYIVRSGDTLQGIAANVYGDSSLWYKIAAANGMTGEAALIEGQSLNMPSGVVKTSHNANTIKPYSPGDIQGDLNPTTPHPQAAKKGKKCGVIGAILLVVVAVVVTLATAGATAGFLGLGSFAGTAGVGTVGGALAGAGAALGGTTLGLTGFAAVAVGAGAAAVGSIASQAVGVATGIQEKFSWKGVALAAISGGVGGGLGNIPGLDTTATGLGTGEKIFRGAVKGVLSSSITQGVAVATGLQDKFSWAGVAAAGVAGGVSAGIHSSAKNFASGLTNNERVAGAIAGGLTATAASIASAATRSAIDGTSFGDGIIAAIPDVIGQAMSGYISACFTGETLVHTPHGMKRIDEIKVGDWVYSRDEHFEDERVQEKRVIELYRFEDRATLDVTVSFEDGEETTLRTTPEHPFAIIVHEGDYEEELESGRVLNADVITMTKSLAWRSAGDLNVGEKVIDIQGRNGLVTALEPVGNLSTVHNFAVEDHHTYYVGDQGVWVHNRYDAQEIAKNVIQNIDSYEGSLMFGGDFKTALRWKHDAGAGLVSVAYRDAEEYAKVYEILEEAGYADKARAAELSFQEVFAEAVYNATGGAELANVIMESDRAHASAVKYATNGNGNINARKYGGLVRAIGTGAGDFDPNPELAVAMLGHMLADHSFGSGSLMIAIRKINEPTLSDIAHFTLDVLGLVPVFGAIADVANGAFYAAEGKPIMAGVSFAAAVPVAGHAATIGKFGGRAAKATLAVSKFGNTAAEAAFKLAGRACFGAGTIVHTKDGLKPIEDIREGDMVWSRSEHDEGDSTWRKVLKAGVTGEETIYEIQVSNSTGSIVETFRTTELHPFWSEDRGKGRGGDFVAAADMRVGEKLRLHDGTYAYVTKIEKTDVVEEVYNLTVDGFHTYHIGELGVWVHNECLAAAIRRIKSEGHAIRRHGEGVNDYQLKRRARTGIAPDGTSMVRDGRVVLPDSTAFNSNELLAMAERAIRDQHLPGLIKNARPGQTRVVARGVDLGTNLGRGVRSGGSTVVPNLQSATAVFDWVDGKWVTSTIYPAF